jgi:hypothetical protein
MFKRHPWTYVEATLAGTYQYYYPYSTVAQPPFKYLAWEHIDHRHAGGMMEAYGLDSNTFPVDYPRSLSRIRIFAIHKLQNTFAIPGITMLYNTGIYFWILLLCITQLLRKKNWRTLVTFIPLVLLVLISLVSPVNGNLRYILPMAAVMFVWCALTIAETSWTKRKENTEHEH